MALVHPDTLVAFPELANFEERRPGYPQIQCLQVGRCKRSLVACVLGCVAVDGAEGPRGCLKHLQKEKKKSKNWGIVVYSGTFLPYFWESSVGSVLIGSQF